MITARPFYFGTNQELFGWYHAPDASYNDLGVVIVSPNGYEMVNTYWGWRRCAERLAVLGVPTLRFDLHGTGDSLGDDQQPDRVAAWLASIEDAIDALKQHSGVTRIVLLGMRLGATLAATVASAREDVMGLVLYVPCTSGRTYVREVRALAATARTADIDYMPEQRNSDDVVMAGWLLTEQTISDLSKLDLSKQSFTDKQVLYLSRSDSVTDQRLLQSLQASAATVTLEEAANFGAFAQDALFGREPDGDFRSIENWLNTISLSVANEGVNRPVTMFHQVLKGLAFTEQLLIFGVQQAMFGVLCLPARQEVKSCVVFINTGATHHIGSHRIAVTLARELAAHGIASLRMDVGGVGDSPVRTDRVANHVYYIPTADDVIVAVDELHARGIHEITLIGICSGSYLAYYAAVKGARIKSVVLVNLQRFIWRDGDSLEYEIRKSVPSMGTYMRRVMQLQTWKRLLSGDVNLRHIASAVPDRLLKLFRSKCAALLGKLPGLKGSENEVAKNCKTLLQNGIGIRMIYSHNDGGLDEVAAYLGTNARALKNRPGFDFITIPDADHTFTTPTAIHQLLKHFIS